MTLLVATIVFWIGYYLGKYVGKIHAEHDDFDKYDHLRKGKK